MITRILHSLFFYLLTAVAMLVCIPPIFLCALLPQRWRFNRFCFFCAHIIYKAMLIGAWVPITIKGKENLPKSQAVYAANHQSALDIPLIGSLLYGKPHIWLLKHELTKVPILGWIGKSLGVSVDRRSPRIALRSLSEAVALGQENKRSLMIFPEGGRYTDGRIHDFLWGFAIIAKKLGLPVVPMLIHNAYKVYPPSTFLLDFAPITVVIGPPMSMKKDESDEEFVKRVQKWFEEKTAEF